DRLEVNVLHDRNPQYVLLSDGSIRNGYTVKLLNKIPEPRTIVVTLDGLSSASMTANGVNEPEGRAFAVRVEPDRLRTLKVYVRQPASDVAGPRQSFKFRVADSASIETDSYAASFVAPEAP